MVRSSNDVSKWPCRSPTIHTGTHEKIKKLWTNREVAGSQGDAGPRVRERGAERGTLKRCELPRDLGVEPFEIR